LRKCKSSLVEEAVVETPAKESTGREKFSKLKKVKSRNRRKSVIVDSEEADENKGCGNSKRYEKTTKSTENDTENADEFSDCESGEEYNFVNDIPEDGEEDTSSKLNLLDRSTHNHLFVERKIMKSLKNYPRMNPTLATRI